MNKYIKLLIESFFDDIEDDVLGTDDTLTDINVNTATILQYKNITQNIPYTDTTVLPEKFGGDILNNYCKYAELAKLILDMESTYICTTKEIASTFTYKISYDNGTYTLYINTSHPKVWRGDKSKLVITGNEYLYIPSSEFMVYEFGMKRWNCMFLYFCAKIYKQFKLICKNVICKNLLSPYKTTNQKLYISPIFNSADMFKLPEQQKYITEYLKVLDMPVISNTSNEDIYNFKSATIFNLYNEDSPEYIVTMADALQRYGIKQVIYGTSCEAIYEQDKYPAYKAFILWSIANSNQYISCTKGGKEQIKKVVYYIISNKLKDISKNEYHIVGYNIRIAKTENDKLYGKFVNVFMSFTIPVGNTNYKYGNACVTLYMSGKYDITEFNIDK